MQRIKQVESSLQRYFCGRGARCVALFTVVKQDRDRCQRRKKRDKRPARGNDRGRGRGNKGARKGKKLTDIARVVAYNPARGKQCR